MTDALVDASRQAVDLAISLLATTAPGDKTYKTDRDFATAADLLIEREVRALLEKLTPDVPFFGEEYGGQSSMGTYWCLDPIDGTLNYSRSIPMHGVSLAYVENGVPQLGEIALPALGERYQMIDGTPTCNRRSISVSDTSTLREAVVSVGDFATGEGSQEKNRTRLATLAALADNVQRVRMLGSAATDLAWLSIGRLDAVIMHSNKRWDVTAGIALAAAAGAVITAQDGSRYSLESSDLVAATPAVYSRLTEVLDRH
jgi:myo-inositol-1(or 4)-monophosphatase